MNQGSGHGNNESGGDFSNGSGAQNSVESSAPANQAQGDTPKKRQEFSGKIDQPPHKQVKSVFQNVDGAVAGCSILREGLLSASSATALRKFHDESGPYQHVIIENLCNEDRMRTMHDECVNNMTTTFKETDLFKVYQTCDLFSIDTAVAKAATIPTLLELRKTIYSAEYREFVAKITGVTDLTDRVDISCNAFAQGCHLLCHDDVIGTRRISFIIYIPDPSEPWTEQDGGALEL
jgi:prolyl 3-hydroxylase /prolyl 3,4-dihydroxylase